MSDLMDDMRMLDDLGTALDPAGAVPPVALRHPALAGTRLGAARRSMPALRWQLGWRVAASGALAAAVAVGVLVSQVDGTGGPRVGDRPGGAPAFAAPTDPAAVLNNAALVAFRSQAPRPRPEQMVFVESVNEYGSTSGDGTHTPGVPTIRQVWLSVDGTHDGLVRSRPKASPDGWESDPLPGCRDGKLPIGDGSSIPCEPFPAYRDDLPTTPDAMRVLLYSGKYTYEAEKPSRDQRAFTMVGDLLRENYIPPAALAALFEAAGTIPGTAVDRDAVDYLGRRGVAVTRSENGSREALIFDAKTYEYLGEAGPSARLRITIVDKAGQLP